MASSKFMLQKFMLLLEDLLIPKFCWRGFDVQSMTFKIWVHYVILELCRIIVIFINNKLVYYY